jgi:phage baseplate assembly protein gpV
VPASAPTGGVSFVYPPDGAKVFSDMHLVFGVDGLRVRPAGEDAADHASGHHHLIIDGEPIPAGAVVPADATHLHFGKGQTSVEQTLTPGKHTLTLQFADGAHISYGPAFSKTIHLEVVPKPAKLGVSFASPKDGAKLHGETLIKFQVEGMTLTPAGENVLDKTSGHHHLIIDGEPTPVGSIVPADATHLHFGKAQTETKLKLEPGPHTLTLQFADGAHASYGPAMSATIHVEVK